MTLVRIQKSRGKESIEVPPGRPRRTGHSSKVEDLASNIVKVAKLRGWRTRDYVILLVTLSIFAIAAPLGFILSIAHPLLAILGMGTRCREWRRRVNLVGRRPILDCVVSTTDGLFKLRRSIDHLGTAWTMLDEGPASSMFQPEDGETALDVGANIGLYTVRASRLVGSQGKVIAIEAEPANFDALLFNLKLNQSDNVVSLNLAAWNRETTLDLHLFDCAQSHSLVSALEKARPRRARVEARPLDKVLEELGVGSVDWVKIDVEGAEVEVLQGLEKTMSRNPNLKLQVEVHTSETADKCLSLVTKRGFEARWLDDRHLFVSSGNQSRHQR